MEQEQYDQIMAKLNEILAFLHNRKPEVDTKLEEVGTRCDISKSKV